MYNAKLKLGRYGINPDGFCSYKGNPDPFFSVDARNGGRRLVKTYKNLDLAIDASTWPGFVFLNAFSSAWQCTWHAIVIS
jgi:hypothetical protein